MGRVPHCYPDKRLRKWINRWHHFIVYNCCLNWRNQMVTKVYSLRKINVPAIDRLTDHPPNLLKLPFTESLEQRLATHGSLTAKEAHAACKQQITIRANPNAINKCTPCINLTSPNYICHASALRHRKIPLLINVLRFCLKVQCVTSCH